MTIASSQLSKITAKKLNFVQLILKDVLFVIRKVQGTVSWHVLLNDINVHGCTASFASTIEFKTMAHFRYWSNTFLCHRLLCANFLTGCKKISWFLFQKA